MSPFPLLRQERLAKINLRTRIRWYILSFGIISSHVAKRKGSCVVANG